MRGLYEGRVEFNRTLCREHLHLRVRLAGGFPPTQPGQFIQLGCRPPDSMLADRAALHGEQTCWRPDGPPRLGQIELCGAMALLRRPFSLAGRVDEPGGAVLLDVIHRVVGVGTAWLAALEPGDPVDLLGPLGNQFDLPPGKSLGLMVGGGVGLPPMFYLAEALGAAGWDGVGFVGAMTADLLAVDWEEGIPPSLKGEPVASIRQFARCGFPSVVTTDDGSLGLPGRITMGLERYLSTLDEPTRRRAVVYTCGPEPMMRAAAAMAESAGIDCQVCLEQAMACGMGTCQSCIVRIEHHPPQPDPLTPAHGCTPEGRAWRYNLACTDGPVFPSNKVVW